MKNTAKILPALFLAALQMSCAAATNQLTVTAVNKLPLTSATIDIWSKRTPRMVVNDWYLADDYHEDHGDGFDDYSAGKSRGCGGNGLWAADQLWVSQNFVNSRALANGPIRVLFELDYE